MKSKAFIFAVVAVVALALAPGLALADEAGLAAGSASVTTQASGSSDVLAMHRLYNPNSGEHFYTADAAERDNVEDAGWRYEGIGWYAPASGDEVYRLYNPNVGDHHYTLSASERDHLVSVGWRYEGVGWRSDTSKTVALLRQYNPNAQAGSHNFTTSADENANLVRAGWNAEGIAWYGVAEDDAAHGKAMFDQYGHGRAKGTYLTACKPADIDGDGDEDLVMLRFQTEGQWCEFLVYQREGGRMDYVLAANVYGAWSTMTAYAQAGSIVTEAPVHGTAGKSYNYYKKSGSIYVPVAYRTLPTGSSTTWDYYLTNGSSSTKVSQAEFESAVAGMESGTSVTVSSNGYSNGTDGWTTYRQGKRV